VVVAALEKIQQLNVDHTAITGDLTNIGQEAEFQHVARLLEQYYPTGETLSVIPGNHDYYVTDCVENDYFKQYLGRYATTDVHLPPVDQSQLQPNQSATSDLFPYIRIRNGIMLLGLNSGAVMPPFHASGVIGEHTWQQLLQPGSKQLIQEAMKTCHTKVLLVHHPPCEDGKHKNHDILDIHRLWEIVGAIQPHVILHGHCHTASVYQVAGLESNPIVIDGGSSSLFPTDAHPLAPFDSKAALPTFHVYEFKDGRKGFSGIRYRWWKDAWIGEPLVLPR